MSSRSYLSIGDVLTLLRQEFPDVTISKIRFLESQGLVNPERTPSGYRKFYEHDVERLRWVLRQQREHFLPLKVIRDRLAQEDGEPVDDAGPPEAIAALLRPATSPVIDERAGHERPHPGTRRDETGVLELAVGLEDRIRVDREPRDNLLDGRQLVALLQEAEAQRVPDLLNDLRVRRDAGPRVEVKSNHCTSKVAQ